MSRTTLTIEVEGHNPITDTVGVWTYRVVARWVDAARTEIATTARCVSAPRGMADAARYRAKALRQARRMFRAGENP